MPVDCVMESGSKAEGRRVAFLLCRTALFANPSEPAETLTTVLESKKHLTALPSKLEELMRKQASRLKPR